MNETLKVISIVLLMFILVLTLVIVLRMDKQENRDREHALKVEELRLKELAIQKGLYIND